MNAYEKSIALGLTGTDQAIVDKLKSLSTSNINASKVRLWMSDKGLLTYDGDGWFGSLETKLPELTSELQAGIRDLKARVLSGHPIRTAEIEHAPKVLLIITGIAVAMPEVAGLVSEFYALDGGRPYLTTTPEQFAAQRTAAQAQEELTLIDQAYATVSNETIQPALSDANRTKASIAAALRTAATAMSAAANALEV